MQRRRPIRLLARAGMLVAGATLLVGCDGYCAIYVAVVSSLFHEANLGPFSHPRTGSRPPPSASQSLETELPNVAPGDSLAFGRFGAALAIDGDELVIGDPQLSEAGVAFGGTFHYDRELATWAQGNLEVGGIAPDREFGFTLGMSETMVLVGAPGIERVFIEPRASGGGQSGELEVQTTPESGSRFGSSVATDGETIAVGAPEQGDGVVYLFERDPQDGVWLEVARLEGENTGVGDRFGFALAMDSDRLVVGAPDALVPLGAGTTPGGNVVVFRRSGDTWTRDRLLEPEDGDFADADFGASVALGPPDRIAVSAPGQKLDGVPTGTVSVFTATDDEHRSTATVAGDDLRRGAAPVALVGDRLYTVDVRRDAVVRFTIVGDLIIRLTAGTSFAAPDGTDLPIQFAASEDTLAVTRRGEPLGRVLLHDLTGGPAASKRDPDLVQGQYFRITADADAPPENASELTVPRTVRAPLRWELSFGAFEPELADQLTRGVATLDLIAEGVAPESFARLRAERFGDAWSVSAAVDGVELGVLPSLPGDIVDLALEHDGSTVTLLARARGDARWREVASAADPGVAFVQRMRVEGLDPGATMGVGDYRLTDELPPAGALTGRAGVRDLLLRVGEAQVSAVSLLESAAPDRAGARARLTVAREGLVSALTELSGLVAKRRSRSPFRKVGKRANKAAKFARQALKQLDKDKPVHKVTKRLRKSLDQCGRALAELELVAPPQ